MVSVPLVWMYNKIRMGFGMEAAQVGMALGIAVTLMWIMKGIKIGYKVDRAISEQASIFGAPEKGKLAKLLMGIWGYEMSCQEKSEEMEAAPELDDLGLTHIEAMNLLDQPRRRGRRPDFTLERWLPITAKWETRDPIRDSFTLGELISEFLGTNPDGSPTMSEQSYYKTWRPRAIKELKRRARTQKASDNRSKENT